MTIQEWIEQGKELCESGPETLLSTELIPTGPEQELPGWDTIPVPESEVPPEVRYMSWALGYFPVALDIIEVLLNQIRKTNPVRYRLLCRKANRMLRQRIEKESL